MSLLLDAFARVLTDQQCARRWHRLMAAWEASQDAAERQAVLERLKNLADGEARADLLRLSFLARACDDRRYEHAAGTRMLALEPDDPDWLAAFMAFAWLSALQDLDSRSDFVADLSAASLPRMAERLMQHAVQTLPPEFAPRASDDIRRVAVVVPYVGNGFHTPSMMAVQQCALLARQGVEVRMFSAQELVPPDAALFRGDGRDLKLPPLDTAAWRAILPVGIGMTISDSRFGLPGRWRNMMPVLAGFDPDLVLLVGLYSPLAAALHTLRPTLGISVNSVAPIAPLDVWLSGNPQLGAEPWGGVFPLPLAIHHPYRVRRAPAGSGITRSGLGLEPSAVVWVTAGFRLEHEIRGDWAARMLRLLADRSDAVWLLVGGDGTLPAALRQAPAGRVRAMATRKDVPEVLRCSDIYVNPPRMGGGFSVIEAMAEGLPVVTLAGSDGGDKVGESALPDIDACMERLAALTGNPVLRREAGEALRARFAERFDLEASGPPLLAACRQALALARTRLTRTS